MSLSDVKHQGFAQRLIHRSLSGGRVPHAYLFHGPEGVGKETLAIGLAEVLLCAQPVDQALDDDRAKAVGLASIRGGCQSCEDCRSVAAHSHPDFHLVYRQLNRQHPDPQVRKRKALEIGVDVVRHFVIEKVGLTPVRGRAKVFIIREADRMTVQAQNALLKTLEEPPGPTVIMLLVTSLDRLLPTTLSRCQVVRFDPLPTAFVQDRLTTLLPDQPPEQIAWYARCGDGSLGRSLQQTEDDWYGINSRLMEGFTYLSGVGEGKKGKAIGASPQQRSSTTTQGLRNDHLAKMWIETAKKLGDRWRKQDPDMTETEASRHGVKAVLQLAAQWYADLLRLTTGDSSKGLNRGPFALTPSHVIEAINRLAQAEHQLDLNANVLLCVETLVNDLARLATAKRKQPRIPYRAHA